MMNSKIRLIGYTSLPRRTGIRIQMMPFRLDDVAGTVPHSWAMTVQLLALLGPERSGVGYLTLDEAFVPKGETHRRPGLHVDGAGFGGDPKPFAGPSGMVLCASHFGVRAWKQRFDGEPGEDGDCEHLRPQLDDEAVWNLPGGAVFWLGPTCVHESVPMRADTLRTAVRISMPSDSHWFDGYTPSPFGILPTGPILPARTAQMGFRP